MIDPPLVVGDVSIGITKSNRKGGNVIMYTVTGVRNANEMYTISVPSLARARLIRNNIAVGYKQSNDLEKEFKRCQTK